MPIICSTRVPGRRCGAGLIGATALGESALEAETLSKMALLLGPEGARGVLAEHGGRDRARQRRGRGDRLRHGQIDARRVLELLA